MRTVLWVLAAIVAGSPATLAQSEPSATTQPTADTERVERITRYRGFVENLEDSEATRIAQAEELLLTGWPEATDLVVTLLGPSDEPSTKAVLAKAIANVGRKQPDALDDRLVEPLLALLGNPSEAVANSAGAALAAFPDGQVVDRLSALAADAAAPQRQRLAALAALEPNLDRREVVGELVELLGANDPEIVNRVVTALKRVSQVDHGTDAAAWKQWWETQAAMSEKAWLTGQLANYSRRVSRLEQQLRTSEELANQRYGQLSARLSQALSSLYRQTPPAQKEDLLISWLGDATTEFRRVAASLVAEQISEGNLPSEALRAALRQRYSDESVEVRRAAFEILGALNDPAETGPMLARLEVEQDPRVREAILRVLGKLRNPEAIPPLITELKRENAPDACVAAAADALGMLATRGRVEEAVVQTLIGPLKERFAPGGTQSPAVRMAILGAMAAIGSPEFKPEFEANLSAGDPELLLRAIQGVATVGNGGQLDRLSDLTTHPDARVRQRALSAIGELGREAQLTTVIARLSPATESVEGPRSAAWQAFKQIAGRMSQSEQVTVADRLSDYPNQAAEYLQGLEERLSQINPRPPELPAVREKLARLLESLDRPAEALPYWRKRYIYAQQAGDTARTVALALELLRCSIAAQRPEPPDEVLSTLAEHGGNPEQQTATDMITAHLDALREAGRMDEARTFVSGLDKALTGLAPESLAGLRTYLKTFAEAPAPAATSQPTTSG